MHNRSISVVVKKGQTNIGQKITNILGDRLGNVWIYGTLHRENFLLPLRWLYLTTT
jgi:hypothetical protein